MSENRNLIQELHSLKKKEAPAIEILAQSWDIFVQAIEHQQRKTSKKLQVSKRIGDLQNWAIQNSPQKSHAAINETVELGQRVNLLFNPEIENVLAFTEKMIFWLEQTDWEMPEVQNRVIYTPVEINQTGFEWGGRFRSFQVMHGAVERVKAEVLVTSAEVDDAGNWRSGQALHAIESKIGLLPFVRQLFKGDGLEVRLHFTKSEGAPYNRVIVIGIPTNWGVLNAEKYHQVGKAILSALRAEETWNEGMQSVACSLIGGNRLGNHLDSWVANELISVGRQWMKTSESGNSFYVILFHSHEANSFSAAMDAALGRGIERIIGHPVAEPLRTGVLESLFALPPRLKSASTSLKEALEAEEGLTVESICVFGRMWVECFVNEILKLNGHKPGGELFRNIEVIREQGLAAPWIVSYMHTCRVLGNRVVHPHHKKLMYYDGLHGSDLVVVLSSILALAKFCQHLPFKEYLNEN